MKRERCTDDVVILTAVLPVIALVAGLAFSAEARIVKWRHLSSAKGDLPAPGSGTQQTSCLVFDADKDGINDFVVFERTKAPAAVLYLRQGGTWRQYLVEAEHLRPEAGSDATDIDGDGDIDIAAGGDAGSNEVWWWENPCPTFDPAKAWRRRLIKRSGATKHHDMIFGDFDGDSRQEIALWNQGACKLLLAEIPEDPRGADGWEIAEIYAWSGDGEMEQRGTYPGFKAVNEHEGFAKADMDGDGMLDIVGSGRWFKHLGGTGYMPNIIDASYAFSRAAAGQIIPGGRPEVVLVVGDGVAPLILYEWRKGVWVSRILLPEIDCGHSIALVDFDHDGNLDIWLAEMRLGGGNPDSKNLLLFGDGKGNFEVLQISSGIELHESKIADLDGDGDLDILGKPYAWETPRIDIWLNEGRN